MAISAIQKDSNGNSGKMSYMGSMAVGALGGYASKWAIPLSKSEKNDKEGYGAELSKIRRDARQARADEVEVIRKEASKTLGADDFVRIYDNNRWTTFSEIKKVEDPLSEKLMVFLRRINDAESKVRDEGKRKLMLRTKDIRSTGAFIALGMAVALEIAFVYNLFKATPKKHQSAD